MLLKYNLIPLERAFVFQVLGQDEKLSEYVKYNGPFVASNGWEVRIDAEPEVNVENKTIFLRGDKGIKDLNAHRNYNLDSNYDRDYIIDEVNSALKELVSSFKSHRRYSTTPKYNGNPLAYANKLTGSPVNFTEEVIVVRLW